MLTAVIAAVTLSSSVPKMLHNVHRIVMIGDSITAMGDPGGGYVDLIRQRLHSLYADQNIEVINAGIGGNKSTDMSARFQRDVLDKKPDLVTLSVGINDVWHGFYDNHPNGDGPLRVSLDKYTQLVSDMVDRAHAAGARIVLVSPTVIGENPDKLENKTLRPYVDAEKKIAHDKKCGFVDLNDAFVKELRILQTKNPAKDLQLTIDGVHMNSDGGKLMAYGVLAGLGVPKKDISDLQLNP